MSEINANKLVAKNTLMLYFRMLLSMIVTLYTSRIVLNSLGVQDFGIYNVVGGVVIMIGFLNNALTVSTQRFLTIELGKSDFLQLKKVFNLSITIHFLIAIVILLLAETAGVWFLNSYLTIPANRLVAANWVYQFSILSFLISVISVPYNAAIIANERMNLFAVVGVLEVLLKLAIVYLLLFFNADKLILYAFLIFVVAVIVRIIYGYYCNKYFEECRRLKFFWDKELIKSMGLFASWNLLGVSAGIGYNQGVNILLNMFFGPVVNAARGIAFQVLGAVSNFVNNFQVAVDPAITKNYAQGNHSSTINLVSGASKFSFYLLLLLCMPLLIETRTILLFWLKIVPEYTVVFTRLILIDVLVCSLSGSLQILAQATGNIKWYQIIVSGILLLNLPTSYIALKLGYKAESTFFVSIFYSCLALIMRISILRKIVDFPAKDFFMKVIVRVCIVIILAVPAPLLVYNKMPDSLIRFFVVLALSIISVFFAIIICGLTMTERHMLKHRFLGFLKN